MFFWMFTTQIALVIAAPSDLPSGECASETEHKAESTGKELYLAHCAGCHQADGSGEAGYFPPVVATPWVESAPALTEIMFRGVSGTIHVNNERYASYMSPYGKELTDAEVLKIVHYVQHELNDYPKNTEWTEESVATLRANLTDKDAKAIRGQMGLDALLTATNTNADSK